MNLSWTDDGVAAEKFDEERKKERKIKRKETNKQTKKTIGRGKMCDEKKDLDPPEHLGSLELKKFAILYATLCCGSNEKVEE